jgi:hypothetical protein
MDLVTAFFGFLTIITFLFQAVSLKIIKAVKPIFSLTARGCQLTATSIVIFTLDHSFHQKSVSGYRIAQ